MAHHTLIKVCGVTRTEDVRAAAVLGADVAGINFASESKRFIGSLGRAAALVTGVPERICWAGVFVNADVAFIHAAVSAARLEIVQLHGEEPPEAVSALREQLRSAGVQVWKAVRLATSEDTRLLTAFDCDALVLDTKVAAPNGAQQHGGSGVCFDWALLKSASRRVPWILAGGLTPENVEGGVCQVRPAGVDVASGVEASPGVKDTEKMRRFVEAVRRVDAISRKT